MTGLAGRTVVVTRSLDQAGDTAAQVARHGGVAIVVPLIDIVDDANGMQQLAGIDLNAFRWLVVTSPNGAERVAPLVTKGSPNPKLAAVGTSTAQVLPRCDLIAGRQSAAGLLEVFPSGAGQWS